MAPEQSLILIGADRQRSERQEASPLIHILTPSTARIHSSAMLVPSNRRLITEHDEADHVKVQPGQQSRLRPREQRSDTWLTAGIFPCEMLAAASASPMRVSPDDLDAFDLHILPATAAAEC